MYEVWVVILAAFIGLMCGTLIGMRYSPNIQERDEDWRDW